MLPPSYRAAPGLEAARKEIIRCTGTQFDPEIARAFYDVPNDAWTRIRQQTEDERFADSTSAWSLEADGPLTIDRVQEIVSRIA